MEKSKIKVFLGLINYGTQAGMIAEGLRQLGVEARSYVWSDPFKRKIDVIVNETLSKNRLVRWFQLLLFYIRCLRKYNVFHFYYGRSILPHNIDLLFYHLFGKKVVMEYLGTDADLWPGLNGFDWRGRRINRIKLIRRVQKQAKQSDIQLVCNSRLYEFVDNSIIVPLALDMSNYSYHERHYDLNNLTFMHCPTDRKAKKSDYIESALDKLRNEGYHFNYKCITNVSHEQLKQEYISSDIVIDQLNSWYGTVSVEAMALGRPVVAGYYPHYCHYDERYENLPIINADMYNIYDVLKDILEGKYDLEKIGIESRKFVEKTHALESVSKQVLQIYENL